MDLVKSENIFPQRIFLCPLSANPTKWSNTLKQFVGNLLTNCLSVFDHFVGLALQGLKQILKVLTFCFWKCYDCTCISACRKEIT